MAVLGGFSRVHPRMMSRSCIGAGTLSLEVAIDLASTRKDDCWSKEPDTGASNDELSRFLENTRHEGGDEAGHE